MQTITVDEMIALELVRHMGALRAIQVIADAIADSMDKDDPEYSVFRQTAAKAGREDEELRTDRRRQAEAN